MSTVIEIVVLGLAILAVAATLCFFFLEGMDQSRYGSVPWEDEDE